ncbi:MAG: hypothetical protein IKX40_09010 [Thermoguttaceae bacterium]|nr:hypothetical protein [Thermoguttaceae bacterium]
MGKFLKKSEKFRENSEDRECLSRVWRILSAIQKDFLAAAEGVRRGFEDSAGEDAREPAGRWGFPRSIDYWRLPHFLDGFRRQVVGKGPYLHPGGVIGYAIRYFPLRTKPSVG